MTKDRLVAFSDGVIAVIITIMVLELKTPVGDNLSALGPLVPIFLTYVLSYIVLGIYWVNHHHMLQVTERVNGKILWANLHLLFWLSLIPFTTEWVGENHFASMPTAAYGVVLLGAAISYTILQATIVGEHGEESKLAVAVGSDWKGRSSIAAYLLAVIFAFVNQWVSDSLYALVALMWLVPDRRIERRVTGT